LRIANDATLMAKRSGSACRSRRRMYLPTAPPPSYLLRFTS
jgi:hypothetical protein